MSFDGEQIGSPMTIKGVDFRADNRDYDVSSGMGRMWTSVQVSASECDMSKLVSTYSNNPTTSPTVVFNKAVTLPTITGKPKQFPSDWILNFPFSSGWAYTGNNGVCLDFVFAGGTLANNGPWASTTASYYYLDTIEPSGYVYQTSTPLGMSGNNAGCNDRGVTHTQGASLTSYCYFYSDSYSTANLAGRLQFHNGGNYFGESTPVLILVGFRSLFAGWQFPGVYCNNVHIDMALPTVAVPQYSLGSGGLPDLTFGGQNGVLAEASTGGAEVVTQAAWSDTKSRQLLFSAAARLVIPTKPRSFGSKMLFNYDSNAATGNGPYAGAPYNSIVRYTR